MKSNYAHVDGKGLLLIWKLMLLLLRLLVGGILSALVFTSVCILWRLVIAAFHVVAVDVNTVFACIIALHADDSADR